MKSLSNSKTVALPKVLVFASGTKSGGGSGVQWLLWHMIAGNLPMQVVGIVCNNLSGGVRAIVDRHNRLYPTQQIHFMHLTSFTADDYKRVAHETGAEWFLLSGWIKYVLGLPEDRTVNIHPGPTATAGGQGMHGTHVHQHIVDEVAKGSKAFGNPPCSMVTMHFVTQSPVVGQDYDKGPTFFELRLPVEPDDTADTLGARVNRMEHGWQWCVTRLVLERKIRLVSGKVWVPPDYKVMPYCPAHCLPFRSVGF